MLTIFDAREVLKRAVATKGRDFIYNTTGECSYTPTNQNPDTGCLIGVALDLAGYSFQLGCNINVIGLATENPEMMSPVVVCYFQAAQKVQDTGGTWGDAIDAAEALYRMVR